MWQQKYSLIKDIRTEPRRVTLAKCKKTSKTVIIKFQRPGEFSESSVENFTRGQISSEEQSRILQREISLLKALYGQPGIVCLVDEDLQSDPPYFVQEFCSGGTLEELILERNHLTNTPRKITDIFRRLAEQAGYLHSKGVLVNDYKPDNILFTQEGYVKVGDLEYAAVAGVDYATFMQNEQGICTYLHTQVEYQRNKAYQKALMIASNGYTAPEKIFRENKVIDRTDVFPLGAAFYFALTGRQAFPCQSRDQYAMLLERHDKASIIPPHELTHVSKEISDICMQMLSTNPFTRPTMYKVAERLLKASATRHSLLSDV